MQNSLVLVLLGMLVGGLVIGPNLARGLDKETCGRVVAQSKQDFDAPFFISEEERAACERIGIEV